MVGIHLNSMPHEPFSRLKNQTTMSLVGFKFLPLAGYFSKKANLTFPLSYEA